VGVEPALPPLDRAAIGPPRNHLVYCIEESGAISILSLYLVAMDQPVVEIFLDPASRAACIVEELDSLAI